MLELVKRCSERWSTQDMRCVKCKMVQKNNYAMYCECAGNYVTDLDPDHFQKYLQAAREAAEFFKFEMLYSTCNHFLKGFNTEEKCPWDAF